MSDQKKNIDVDIKIPTNDATRNLENLSKQVKATDKDLDNLKRTAGETTKVAADMVSKLAALNSAALGGLSSTSSTSTSSSSSSSETPAERTAKRQRKTIKEQLEGTVKDTAEAVSQINANLSKINSPRIKPIKSLGGIVPEQLDYSQLVHALEERTDKAITAAINRAAQAIRRSQSPADHLVQRVAVLERLLGERASSSSPVSAFRGNMPADYNLRYNISPDKIKNAGLEKEYAALHQQMEAAARSGTPYKNVQKMRDDFSRQVDAIIKSSSSTSASAIKSAQTQEDQANTKLVVAIVANAKNIAHYAEDIKSGIDFSYKDRGENAKAIANARTHVDKNVQEMAILVAQASDRDLEAVRASLSKSIPRHQIAGLAGYLNPIAPKSSSEQYAALAGMSQKLDVADLVEGNNLQGRAFAPSKPHTPPANISASAARLLDMHISAGADRGRLRDMSRKMSAMKTEEIRDAVKSIESFYADDIDDSDLSSIRAAIKHLDKEWRSRNDADSLIQRAIDEEKTSSTSAAQAASAPRLGEFAARGVHIKQRQYTRMSGDQQLLLSRRLGRTLTADEKRGLTPDQIAVRDERQQELRSIIAQREQARQQRADEELALQRDIDAQMRQKGFTSEAVEAKRAEAAATLDRQIEADRLAHGISRPKNVFDRGEELPLRSGYKAKGLDTALVMDQIRRERSQSYNDSLPYSRSYSSSELYEGTADGTRTEVRGKIGGYKTFKRKVSGGFNIGGETHYLGDNPSPVSPEESRQKYLSDIQEAESVYRSAEEALHAEENKPRDKYDRRLHDQAYRQYKSTAKLFAQVLNRTDDESLASLTGATFTQSEKYHAYVPVSQVPARHGDKPGYQIGTTELPTDRNGRPLVKGQPLLLDESGMPVDPAYTRVTKYRETPNKAYRYQSNLDKYRTEDMWRMDRMKGSGYEDSPLMQLIGAHQAAPDLDSKKRIHGAMQEIFSKMTEKQIVALKESSQSPSAAVDPETGKSTSASRQRQQELHSIYSQALEDKHKQQATDRKREELFRLNLQTANTQASLPVSYRPKWTQDRTFETGLTRRAPVISRTLGQQDGGTWVPVSTVSGTPSNLKTFFAKGQLEAATQEAEQRLRWEQVQARRQSTGIPLINDVQRAAAQQSSSQVTVAASKEVETLQTVHRAEDKKKSLLSTLIADAEVANNLAKELKTKRVTEEKVIEQATRGGFREWSQRVGKGSSSTYRVANAEEQQERHDKYYGSQSSAGSGAGGGTPPPPSGPPNGGGSNDYDINERLGRARALNAEADRISQENRTLDAANYHLKQEAKRAENELLQARIDSLRRQAQRLRGGPGSQEHTQSLMNIQDLEYARDRNSEFIGDITPEDRITGRRNQLNWRISTTQIGQNGQEIHAVGASQRTQAINELRKLATEEKKIHDDQIKEQEEYNRSENRQGNLPNEKLRSYYEERLSIVSRFSKEYRQIQDRLMQLDKQEYGETHAANLRKYRMGVGRYRNNMLLGQAFQYGGQGASQVGQTATYMYSAPVLAAMYSAARNSIAAETTFTTVRQQVGTELGTGPKAEKSLADLKRFTTSKSNEYGIPFEEVAKYEATAGQLGVAGKSGAEGVKEFTDTIIQMGIGIKDMEPENAARSMAKLMNVMELTPKQVHALASELAGLHSIGGAATSTDMLAMTLRIAGVGKIVGLTAPQVMAFGSAVAASGVKAEQGGTSLQRLLIMMALAVEKSASGKRRLAKEGISLGIDPEHMDKSQKALEQFANIAGMTGNKFAETWKAKPMDAILSFIAGIRRLPQEGGNALEALTGLGIKQQRMIATIAQTSGGRLAPSFLAKGQGFYDDDTELQRRVNERMRTFERESSKIVQSLRNSGREVADGFLPIVETDVLPKLDKAATMVARMADAFGRLPTPEREAILGLVAFTAAIGPTVWALGGMATATGAIARAVATIGLLRAKVPWKELAMGNYTPPDASEAVARAEAGAADAANLGAPLVSGVRKTEPIINTVEETAHVGSAAGRMERFASVAADVGIAAQGIAALKGKGKIVEEIGEAAQKAGRPTEGFFDGLKKGLGVGSGQIERFKNIGPAIENIGTKCVTALGAAQLLLGGMASGAGLVLSRLGLIGATIAVAIEAWEGFHTKDHIWLAGIKDDWDAASESINTYIKLKKDAADSDKTPTGHAFNKRDEAAELQKKINDQQARISFVHKNSIPDYEGQFSGDTEDTRATIADAQKNIADLTQKRDAALADAAKSDAVAKHESNVRVAARKQKIAMSGTTFGDSNAAPVFFGRDLASRFGFADVGGRATHGHEADSDHYTGDALDFMIHGDKKKGDALADYVAKNAAAEHAKYVIWQQRIFNPSRDKIVNGVPQWRHMEDRGSPTANHMDHVHVSFEPSQKFDSTVKYNAALFDGSGAGKMPRDVASRVKMIQQQGNVDTTQDKLQQELDAFQEDGNVQHLRNALVITGKVAKVKGDAARYRTHATASEHPDQAAEAIAQLRTDQAAIERDTNHQSAGIAKQIKDFISAQHYAKTIGPIERRIQDNSHYLGTLQNRYDKAGTFEDQKTILDQMAHVEKTNYEKKLALAAQERERDLQGKKASAQVEQDYSTKISGIKGDYSANTLAQADKYLQLNRNIAASKVQSLQLSLQISEVENAQRITAERRSILLAAERDAKIEIADKQYAIDTDPKLKPTVDQMATADQRRKLTKNSANAEYDSATQAIEDQHNQSVSQMYRLQASHTDDLIKKQQLLNKAREIELIIARATNNQDVVDFALQSQIYEKMQDQREVSRTQAGQAFVRGMIGSNKSMISSSLEQYHSLATSGDESQRSGAIKEYSSTLLDAMQENKRTGIDSAAVLQQLAKLQSEMNLSGTATREDYDAVHNAARQAEFSKIDKDVKSIDGKPVFDRDKAAKNYLNKLQSDPELQALGISQESIDHFKESYKSAIKDIGKTFADTLESSTKSAVQNFIQDSISATGKKDASKRFAQAIEGGIVGDLASVITNTGDQQIKKSGHFLTTGIGRLFGSIIRKKKKHSVSDPSVDSNNGDFGASDDYEDIPALDNAKKSVNTDMPNIDIPTGMPILNSGGGDNYGSIGTFLSSAVDASPKIKPVDPKQSVPDDKKKTDSTLTVKTDGGIKTVTDQVPKAFSQSKISMLQGASAIMSAAAALAVAMNPKKAKGAGIGGLLGMVVGGLIGSAFPGGIGIGLEVGGAGGSLLGGMFADGGRPPTGIPSLVGERGPELWIPDRPGFIMSNLDVAKFASRPNSHGGDPFGNMFYGNSVRIAQERRENNRPDKNGDQIVRLLETIAGQSGSNIGGITQNIYGGVHGDVELDSASQNLGRHMERVLRTKSA